MGTMQRNKNKALSYGEDTRFLRGKWGQGRSQLLAAMNDPLLQDWRGQDKGLFLLSWGLQPLGLDNSLKLPAFGGKTARQGREWNAVSLAPSLF